MPKITTPLEELLASDEGSVEFPVSKLSLPAGSPHRLPRVTMTIKKEWLAQIIEGTRKVEYREIKPYWTLRLGGIQVPFELRLINGMKVDAPEAIARVGKVVENIDESRYELHIETVLEVKNVDSAA